MAVQEFSRIRVDRLPGDPPSRPDGTRAPTGEGGRGPRRASHGIKLTRSTILTGLAALVLVAAVPDTIRDTLKSGRIYLFSWEFLADLPARLTGPGRLRFVFQPIMAILLGLRGGLADARAGRPPYLT